MPNKQLAEDLFCGGVDNTEQIKVTALKAKVKKEEVFDYNRAPLRANSKVSGGEKEILRKLEEREYDTITYKDWLFYFVHKAREYDILYVRGNAVIESSVIKKLMRNFSVPKIKKMMDFVWDAWDYPPAVKQKTLCVTIFSQAWLNVIVQLTEEWEAGTYITREQAKKLKEERQQYYQNKKSAPTTSREWTGGTVTKAIIE
jgi:hypothetical protein